MGNYKRIYPGKLKFAKTKMGIKVDYPEESIKKRNPDIWALKFLLDKKLFNFNDVNVITLTKIDTTMALRLHFLPKIFSGVVFSAEDNFELKATDIIKNINTKYKTYSCNFTERGTKHYPESLLETNIWKDLTSCFGDEFSKPRLGIRQFPANIFDSIISEKTRVSRKFWIDILSVNKLNQLSVIELNARGNASLDLLAQAIDYGIFCYLFKKHISRIWFNNLKELSKNKVAVYCIAEKFHPALLDDSGIKSLIRLNDFLDIIFIQIKVEEEKVKAYQFLFDTRKRCN